MQVWRHGHFAFWTKPSFHVVRIKHTEVGVKGRRRGKEVLTNSFGVRLGAGLPNLSPPRKSKGVAPRRLGTLLATGSLGTGIATLSTWHGSCYPHTWHALCYTSRVGTLLATDVSLFKHGRTELLNIHVAFNLHIAQSFVTFFPLGMVKDALSLYLVDTRRLL